jgi:hypothetical protein
LQHLALKTERNLTNVESKIYLVIN